MSRWNLIIVFSLLFACSDNRQHEGTMVGGKVSYPAQGSIYLELLTQEGYEVVDSAQTDDSGAFQLHAPSLDEDIYRINFYNRQKLTIVLSGASIEIQANGNMMDALFKIGGNPGAEALSNLIDLSKAHQLEKDFLKHKIKSANQKGEQAELDSLIRLQRQSEEEYFEKASELVREQKGTLTGLLMLREYFDIESNLELYEELMPVFQSRLAEHWYFKHVLNNYETIRRLAKGAIAPDFELPDPDGTLIALSSLRGKYVYLDFWASWCQPCRRDNPHLVKVYDKYQDKNFEILGVSFDRKKERWLDAIEKDQLGWIHVSDLKYFDSKMIGLYNITNVPTTFLLDPDGWIIAKNLHYNELDQMLSDLL